MSAVNARVAGPGDVLANDQRITTMWRSAR